MARWIPMGAVFLGMLLLCTGCKSATRKPMANSVIHLTKIRDAYTTAVEKLKRPPVNLDELMPYLTEQGDPAEILRSPDDGQDYIILWGMNPAANPAEALAYEQRGKDGRRYVLWGHIVWSLSDEELKKVPFPSGHKSPF